MCPHRPHKTVFPMRRTLFLLFFAIALSSFFKKNASSFIHEKKANRPPNIIFAIADDHSFPHVSIMGNPAFKTPVFDSVARAGILFNNAFVAAPQCSPSRAAILTGRNIWQIEEAGTHQSYFPKKYPVFTEAIEKNGYFVGFTGKAWGPGNFEDSGWKQNPVGKEYNNRNLEKKTIKGTSINDYAANFKEFLKEKPAEKPFFFWYGAFEPHRVYEEGSGAKAGYQANENTVPKFLPNTDLVKNDMLDYALEINWFDTQLGKMLQMLRESGELDNTIIIITADNGMAFPYAKANLQEYGTHVPLAICGSKINGKNRVVNDLISMMDLAPTVLDLTQTPHFQGITGKSMLPILKQNKSGIVDKSREFVLSGRERHTHARPDNLGYPARAIRTKDYLYIKNLKPDLYPAGDPPPTDNKIALENPKLKPITIGYEDIDDSPTKQLMIQQKAQYPALFTLGFEKRDAVQLYDIKKDPFCLNDISKQPNMVAVCRELDKKLTQKLIEQNDPRMTAKGDIFESYPRFGPMKPFEGFKEHGKVNEKYRNK